MVGTGTSTVKHDKTSDAVMQNLGILNNGGRYVKVLQATQDARYTVDGAAFTSGSNTVTLTENGENHATVTLTATGTRVVSNSTT
ncbi:hypothetical protein [Effusibacillus lacus]|uniref:hypothetical protein n=1 Tax=Effusibacillus lacus TaxID=1348429 RepID=UPI000BB9B870|nr:hypothetical protein [Effusibacillus lacus]